MTVLGIFMLVIGVFLCPVSFVLVAISFFTTSSELKPFVTVPSMVWVMWIVGLFLMIASFRI